MLPLPWLQHGYDSLEAFDLREQIPLNGLMPRRTDVYYNFLENLTSGKSLTQFIETMYPRRKKLKCIQFSLAALGKYPWFLKMYFSHIISQPPYGLVSVSALRICM
tara:strand:- start:2307 stop:2624 length:318 start_codon:yes stop_codon:yes gene_type:complete